MTDTDFHKLVGDHYNRLFRAARFMCGSEQAAEDLLHDTFLAAGDALASFEGRSSTYTWLYGILLNKFRRWLRQKQRRIMSLHELSDDEEHHDAANLPAAGHPGPAENAERREAALHVREAIAELSANHRGVITLRYIEGLSYQEIAEMLDCPVGTVKSRIHYALQKIAGALKHKGLAHE